MHLTESSTSKHAGYMMPHTDSMRLLMAYLSIFSRHFRLHLPGVVALAGDVKKIADIGCGPGQRTLEAALQYPQARVVGIDNDPAIISKAKAAQTASAANLDFLLGDVEIEFPEHNFDIVLAANIFVHLHVPQPAANSTSLSPPSMVTAIENCRAAMRPGGILWVQEVDGESAVNAIKSPDYRIGVSRVYELARQLGTYPDFAQVAEKLFTDNGFEIVRVFDEPYPIGLDNEEALTVLRCMLLIIYNSRMAVQSTLGIPAETTEALYEQLCSDGLGKAKPADFHNGIINWKNWVLRAV